MAPAVLFPFFGMQRAIYSGVILNWLVAAGAATAQWYQGGRRVEIQPETMPSTPAETVPCLSFLVAVGLAFLSGFVSLSYEMFCFRTLSYATASSAVAFAATLGTFLLGLASGSRQAGRDSSGQGPA